MYIQVPEIQELQDPIVKFQNFISPYLNNYNFPKKIIVFRFLNIPAFSKSKHWKMTYKSKFSKSV